MKTTEIPKARIYNIQGVKSFSRLYRNKTTGILVCFLRVLTQHSYKTKDGIEKTETQHIPLVAYNGLATELDAVPNGNLLDLSYRFMGPETYEDGRRIDKLFLIVIGQRKPSESEFDVAGELEEISTPATTEPAAPTLANVNPVDDDEVVF